LGDRLSITPQNEKDRQEEAVRVWLETIQRAHDQGRLTNQQAE
jgi:hypothetical protein